MFSHAHSLWYTEITTVWKPTLPLEKKKRQIKEHFRDSENLSSRRWMTTGPLAAEDQQTHIYRKKQSQDGHLWWERAAPLFCTCNTQGHALCHHKSCEQRQELIASLRSTIWNVGFTELRRRWVNSLGIAVASWFKGKRLIILEFHLALLVRWSGHFGDLWCLCIVPCTFPSFSRSLRSVPFWNAQSVSDYINPCSSNRAGVLTQNSQLLVLCAVNDNIHEPFYLQED